MEAVQNVRQLLQRREQAKKDAKSRYRREIIPKLIRGIEPDPSELDEVMVAAGVTVEELTLDVAKVSTRTQLADALERGRKAVGNAAAADAAVAKLRADWLVTKQQHEESLRAALKTQSEWHLVLEAGQSAKEKLLASADANLQERHEKLLWSIEDARNARNEAENKLGGLKRLPPEGALLMGGQIFRRPTRYAEIAQADEDLKKTCIAEQTRLGELAALKAEMLLP